MSDFIFENKELNKYRNLNKADRDLVQNSLMMNIKSVQCMWSDGEWNPIEDEFDNVFFDSVYRILLSPKSPLDIAFDKLTDEASESQFFNPNDRVVELTEALSIATELAKSLGDAS